VTRTTANVVADFIVSEFSERRRRGIFAAPNPVVTQAPSGVASSEYAAPGAFGSCTWLINGRILTLPRSAELRFGKVSREIACSCRFGDRRSAFRDTEWGQYQDAPLTNRPKIAIAITRGFAMF
jgi:hypothetical protein